MDKSQRMKELKKMYYNGNEFRQLTFPKTGEQIKERGVEKIRTLKLSLKSRERAIQAIVKEAGLTSSVDILLNVDDLLNENFSCEQAPSEVKARLQNVVRKVRDEKEELSRLELMVRNLPDNVKYDLSFDSLSYFGF